LALGSYGPGTGIAYIRLGVRRSPFRPAFIGANVYLPVSAMHDESRSPLHILEKMTKKKLVLF
jgi:hypothetical protein